MKNIMTIIKKEFARFFGDKRLVFGTIILPGLLIFVLYTLIGTVMDTTDKEYTAKVINPSAVFSASLGTDDKVLNLEEIPETDKDSAIEEVKSGKIDLLIVFPLNFDDVFTTGISQNPPNVEIYYDSASTTSLSAYNLAAGVLNGIEDVAANLFNINIGQGGDLSTQKEAEGSYYAMILPFLILTFMYSGCMGIAPESIAGEKERGTIATLLVTPVKRSEIAIGKILALSVLSALSAISSFIGTFLSMPKLMGGSIGSAIAGYTVGEYLALFAVMLTAVLLIVTLISIISSFAKSVKEATAYAVPLMVVIILIGLSSMIFPVGGSHVACLIPIFNCVQVMSGIFSMQFSVIDFIITVVSNLVYVALLVFVLTKMFKSERIIFNK